MNAKFYRLLTFAIFILGIVGLGSIGLNLITKYQQVQQLEQMHWANEMLSEGKYQQAIAAYEELEATDLVKAPILWTNRGYAYLGLDRYTSALESCSQATTLNPRAALAWNCKGEAQFYLGNNNAALTAMNRAIALEPNNATFKLNQSQVLQELGQHRQAIELNQNAIALLKSQQSSKNTLAMAFKGQGQSWLELDQNQKALSAFDKSLIYKPKDVAAQQGLAIALYRLGEYSQAIKTIEQILDRQDLTIEQQAINWLYKAISLCETPQISKSKAAFSNVIKFSNNPELLKIAKSGCGIR